MNKKYCDGCYRDVYNHGCGGSKQCWMFENAKVVWRKEVHVDQRPPFRQPQKRVASCYQKQHYWYITKQEARKWDSVNDTKTKIRVKECL